MPFLKENPQRFIMIDDDAISNVLSQQLVRKIFGNVEIELFVDPYKALHYIEKNYNTEALAVPTVLFLDLYTPAMTGWEFLEKYKTFHESVHKHFSIFILSSSEDRKDVEAAMTDHFVAGHIIKPLKRGILEQLRMIG